MDTFLALKVLGVPVVLVIVVIIIIIAVVYMRKSSKASAPEPPSADKLLDKLEQSGAVSTSASASDAPAADDS